MSQPPNEPKATAGDSLPDFAISGTASEQNTVGNDGPATDEPKNLDLIMTIPVQVQVVLGRASMPVADLMQLQRGSIIGLDHHVGDPVEVTANGRTIARGEVVLLDDDSSRFGVSLTQIVSSAFRKL